jgi:hypothetical protein
MGFVYLVFFIALLLNLLEFKKVALWLTVCLMVFVSIWSVLSQFVYPVGGA